jgi:hypothetical protein
MHKSHYMYSFFLLIILSSCMSRPEQIETAEPDWLSNPPAEEGFFYGIGGSNTQNEGDDREIAMARAQSDLAASISVDIISELELNNKVAADGSSKETLESRVHQSVSQSLVNLQTLDNWYSESRGYWILLRMDKVEWENQRKSDRRVSIPVPVGLDENSGYNIPFLAALTSMDLPLQLLPGGKNTPYELTLDWVVSDYPVIDESGGIVFSKLSGIVCLKQYGLILYSREYGPLKEGGLSHEQARERAAVKVMNEFRNDVSFKDDIGRMISE